jgi:hypothetical protein
MTATKDFMIANDVGSIKIFFDERLYNVEGKEILVQCSSHVLKGEITGYNIMRLEYGEIELNFNPVRISSDKAEAAATALVAFIKSKSIYRVRQ